MDPKNFHFSIQILVIIYIYISISTVHGDYVEEVNKCCAQIKNVFGNCEIASECLRYAIKHYVYDENTASQHSEDQIFSGLEDLPDFDGFQELLISEFNNNVQNYTEPNGQNVDPQQILNLAKQYHYALPTVDEGTDYAKEYHLELESRIVGNGVPNREYYCSYTYNYSLDLREKCWCALIQFGTYSNAAVKWAFKRYTLDECLFLQSYFPEYKFITDYMKLIIEKGQINTSKKPLKFCREFVSKNQKANNQQGQWN